MMQPGSFTAELQPISPRVQNLRATSPSPLAPPDAPPIAAGKLFDKLQEAICIVNRFLRVRHWNPAMAALTGVSAEEARGKELFSLLPAAFEHNLRPHIQPALSGDESFTGEIMQNITENDLLSFRYRLARFPQPDEPLLMLSLLDTTDRQRLSRERARHEQLSTLGALSVNVAQELSYPLDQIYRQVEKVLQALHAQKPMEAKAHLSAIINQSYRISCIAHNLVALAQPPATARVSVHLNVIVEEAVELWQHENGGRQGIIMQLQENLPRGLGDPALLFSALQILLPICIELAGDDAVPRLTTEVDAKTQELCVRVDDRGPGMPEGEVDRLFEFYCGSTCFSPGASLGLFIIKKIIESQQGRFEIHSRPGTGTTFLLKLPGDLTIQTGH